MRDYKTKGVEKLAMGQRKAMPAVSITHAVSLALKSSIISKPAAKKKIPVALSLKRRFGGTIVLCSLPGSPRKQEKAKKRKSRLSDACHVLNQCHPEKSTARRNCAWCTTPGRHKEGHIRHSTVWVCPAHKVHLCEGCFHAWHNHILQESCEQIKDSETCQDVVPRDPAWENTSARESFREYCSRLGEQEGQGHCVLPAETHGICILCTVPHDKRRVSTWCQLCNQHMHRKCGLAYHTQK